jgi:hypothetical protein
MQEGIGEALSHSIHPIPRRRSRIIKVWPCIAAQRFRPFERARTPAERNEKLYLAFAFATRTPTREGARRYVTHGNTPKLCKNNKWVCLWVFRNRAFGELMP